MNLTDWFYGISRDHKRVHFKLFLAFALFFIVPVTGMTYFGIKYDIVTDRFFAPFVILFLTFMFLGFRILRKTFDHVKDISSQLSQKAHAATQKPPAGPADELGGIVQSFQNLEDELENKKQDLDRKISETETLKELYDLSYMTLNADYLLFIALERALRLVKADTGSVMMLSRPDKEHFIIKANIGQSEHAKKGMITDFDNSIAKYTVINKAPLLVEDIEKDHRFGRQARNQYATRSFICMPLKTSHDIIGVVTISRQKSNEVFTPKDVDLLIPLLSNTAYIYDNINMYQEMLSLSRNIQSMRIISKTINSSLKGQEMAQEIFEQMRKNIAFDTIALLQVIKASPHKLSIVDFRSFISTNLNRGRTFTYEGTILEKAINEQRNIFIPDVKDVTTYIDKKLLGQPGVNTALIMPLKVEGRVTSLILIFNIQQNDWNRLNEIIDIMGDHLSLAMEKDHMIESLIRRDRVLDTLRVIGGALAASTFDTEKVLSHTMEIIRAVLPVEAGYLMMPENDELAFTAAFHLDMQKLKTIKLPKGAGVAGHVFESGISLIVNDSQDYPDLLPMMQEELGFSPRTMLCVPLITRGKVKGVIAVLNKLEGPFNEADEKMLQSISVFLSTALENANLYRKAVSGSAGPPLLDMGHESLEGHQ